MCVVILSMKRYRNWLLKMQRFEHLLYFNNIMDVSTSRIITFPRLLCFNGNFTACVYNVSSKIRFKIDDDNLK